MTLPLFSVGEIVILKSKTSPQFNGEYEVFDIILRDAFYTDRLNGLKVKATYHQDTNKDIPGYRLDVPMLNALTKKEIVWDQSALRKKHQGSGFSFSVLMKSMKCEEPA